MTTGSTSRQLKIEGGENPTMSNIIRAFDGIRANVPSSVTFTVVDGSGKPMIMEVQVTGIGNDPLNPGSLEFKGLTRINGHEHEVTGYYNADGRRSVYISEI